MTLIYPTAEVPLADLARAALAMAGAFQVRVVTGQGSTAVQVPDDCAHRVAVAAGLAVEPAAEAAVVPVAPPGTAPGPDGGAPSGPGAPNALTITVSPESRPPARADARTPGRPAAAAEKKTTGSRRTARRNEKG